MKADLTLGALVRSAAVRGSFEPLAFLQANEARDPSAQVVGLFSELCDEDRS